MLQLKRVGYNVMHEKGFFIDRPFGSGDYLFILFRSKMELILAGKTQFVDKNSYIIYKKGSSQFYKDFEPPIVHDWFHFDGEDLEAFFSTLQLPFDTVLTAHDPFYISRKIQDLQLEYLQNGALKNEIIHGSLQCLFMKLSDIRDSIAPHNNLSKYYNQFVALRNEIYNAPQNNFTVAALAHRVNMSRSYFQHIYKEIFGISIVSDIISNRLEYGMYLLGNTTYTISYISELCGYTNDVHFMRQFKKTVGITPSEYRSNTHLEKLQ